MNKVILIGNLGSDPELKVTQGGKSMLKLLVATTETWKDDKGQKQERTEWHRCTLFGSRAEGLAKYLQKGTKVAITGSIRYSKSGEGDSAKYFTDINVDDLEFVGGGKGGGKQQQSDNDEVPF